MESIVRGVVWKCGDGVSAYDIIGKDRWTMDKMDPAELGKWALEGALPAVRNVPFGFKNLGYEIVIAGTDFGGGGKSIEHPIVALKGAGVTLVIAESFARYTFRNAINLGLPAIQCKGITEVFETGQQIEADLLSGKIRNLSTGASIEGTPLTDFVLDLVGSGGLLEYMRAKLASGRQDT
ncbi:MAG: 3-isopropylmalate dehydratase [Firmicutes bacterium]|nr:3-isopropylmalate dehydratase [Bacillota bacterium]